MVASVIIALKTSLIPLNSTIQNSIPKYKIKKLIAKFISNKINEI